MTDSLTIIGLGYVGLPLAQEACRSGLAVAGLDTDPAVAAGLMDGKSHIDDTDSANLAKMLEAGFSATTDSACLRDSDVVVICVPTPLDEEIGRAHV